VESYDRAIAIDAGSAEFHCCRGTALRRLHYVDDALESYERAIALKHDYPAAHQFRANTLLALERRDEAIAAYQLALSLGGDAAQIHYALAALGTQAAPAAAPEGYVKALFDQYAGHFDQHLVEVLAYQTPAVMDASIRKWQAPEAVDTLDLGCGTGLCGPYLRTYSRSLTGVDLSERMLDKARQRGLYDHLECAEVSAFLALRRNEFDLIVAADVFVYVGDLTVVFTLAHHALRPNGYFCFSAEASEDRDVVLGASNRYAHSLPYLRRLAGAVGFDVLEAERQPLRSENGAQLMGYVLMLRKLKTS
jgi:predicted TPR repeat methyltransferase